MRFVDNKGRYYEAQTKEGLLVEIMDLAKHWLPTDSTEVFMFGCAMRIYKHYDVNITYEDAEEFVDELIRLELIKEIN